MEDDKIFDQIDLGLVEPNNHSASILFSYISKKTIESLLYLVEVYEEYYQLKLNQLKENIRGCLKYKPNPKLFFFHHALKSAIESQDPQYATAIIERFKNHCTSDFSVDLSKRISYINLDDEEWLIDCAKISSQINSDNNQPLHNEIEKKFLNEISNITEEVLHIISEHYRSLYLEIMVHVNTIILSYDGKLIGPLGYPLVGGTSVAYHGALFMQIPKDYIFFKELILEHIVHEAAHIHLNAILATDPLVLNNISELYISSVRKDPRPMIGIYHSMFVSCRVLMAFDACRAFLDDGYMLKQYPIVQEQFNKVFLTCEKDAQLTKLGKCLLENCRKYLR